MKKRGNLKYCVIVLILSWVLSPVLAQQANTLSHRYKVAACDWMMLKRQKLGEFKLSHEIGADGVEMDMGGLGKRDTFDNKLHQVYFQELFKKTAAEYQIEVPSIAMSGFYGQSFLKHRNYRVLIDDCIKTMQVMGAKIAYLPLGGCGNDWKTDDEQRRRLVSRLHVAGEMAHSEGLVIGIRTGLSAKEDIKLLEQINSEGIQIYFSVQEALDNKRDLYKELKTLGRKRICQIHISETDGVTLPHSKNIDMHRVKEQLDKMGWSGWLVVERSRDAGDVRNVKKNFGMNIRYLKEVFQDAK
ncbi:MULTISPECIES: sugar phosphate isomerase/epimerase family protein [Bacteroides]|jgi:sugar phosphate isomerase/epimerase|nr:MULTISPECIES: sugar phosphate isomerase/epimerase family protein [Bacteroides]EEC55026.1 AP endonuclease, family 2 [Bacteroides eggerthii DSM 20697]KAA5273740.1 sugar phosphate isomerase/epimerase [Bacteroides eggerthii]KAA5286493.1 sugar phosphate isomerase/epimerase [Bacteroides eggerthii]MBU8972374.1 sugar phosphate isomerase/epimerase [Bacteroides eggerthii]MBU8997174.1 sugar phosphate isomerase/epimerase [Bacteroides eggerthii]